MFVKVYRYRIQPEKTKRFLAIQERAGKIYQKHIRHRVVILRSRKDLNLCLEVHWYPDEDTYRRGIDLINAEPMIDQLWEEFQATLDPNDPTVHEEYYEQLWFDNSLTTK
ncbi:MAG: hypothetical protein ACE5I5_10625 [Candidatus Heimdallarchaeota archaeon]